MKIRAAMLLAALALGACSEGTAVVVSVTSPEMIAVDHFAVTATIGSASAQIPDVPTSTATIPPAQTFVIDVGDNHSGMMTVTLTAESKSNEPLATASGAVELVHGKQVTLELVLGSFNDDAGVGVDGGEDAQADDAALPCGTATTACNTNTLVTTCSTSSVVTTELCALGCAAGPPARCEQMVPTAPVMTGDVYSTDVSSLTLTTGSVVFDTDTGGITNGATVIRAPNTGASVGPRQVDPASGIAFSILSIAGSRSMALWSFSSLTISAGASVYFAGENAVGITTSGDAEIDGYVSLLQYDPQAGTECTNEYNASPGGGGPDHGGFPGTGGDGVEGEGTPIHYGGGGGGGFGAPGGAGAFAPTNNPGGSAGPTYGTPSLSPIIGGSGGGWAQNETQTKSGAGGGAIQLDVGGTLTVKGTITAAGCGGKGGGQSGGAGGGSGGAILVETPLFTLGQNAVLAVNGGGGAPGGCTTNGQNGQPSAVAAAGGACAPNVGSAGGTGGSDATPTGGSTTEEGPFNTTYFAGGGGGGVGLMHFNVQVLNQSTATLSPKLGSSYTTQSSLSAQ